MELITPEEIQVECKRCGECCEKGSPTLHFTDAHLIKEGILTYKDMFTIREGELVYNNIEDEFITIDYELIKLNEKKGSRVCSFYDEENKACTIYENRPGQCQAFECWNTQKLVTFYSGEKLTRDHLVQGAATLIDILNTHDKKCSYTNLTDLVERIRGGVDLVSDVIAILQYDQTIRDVLHEKLNIPREYLPLLLGRSMKDTIIMYGYRIEEEENGDFCIVTLS